MPQTLRTTFSPRSHNHHALSLRHGVMTPLTLQDMLLELQQYLQLLQQDLLQPRQQVIDRLLREALY